MALTLAIQKAALAAAAAARQNPQRSLKKWWTKSRYKSGCDSCLEVLPKGKIKELDLVRNPVIK